MMKSPQIEPVTSFIKDHKAILGKLDQGPVFLAQRSKPAAVLVSVEAWDRIARRMRELELLVEAKRSKERNAPTISHDELKRLMLEKRKQGTSSHVGA